MYKGGITDRPKKAKKNHFDSEIFIVLNSEIDSDKTNDHAWKLVLAVLLDACDVAL